MTPLVSILIPAYNSAAWIEETLRSALAQTWPHREIIVVDDGSSDDTVERARRFASSGVRVISQPNAGASAARNRAWRESRGDWLQFLDADDLLEPRKIEHQLRLARTHGPDFAYCARWTRFTRATADADFTPQPLCRDAHPEEWITLKLRDNVMMHPAAWLVSRPLAERAGPWDESLSLDDDGEFFSRVVFASRGVRHCEEALSYYRSNISGSLSKRRTAAAWQSGFRSLELTADRLLARRRDAETKSAVANAYQQLAYSAYPDEPSIAARCERRARELGGSNVQPGGGAAFRGISRFLGWRFARRLQLWRQML